MAKGLTTLTSSDCDDVMASVIWDSFPQISIDYAIMEHAQNVAVIPVDMGWSDVGTFAAIYDILSKNGDGNASRSKHDGHIQIDTTNTLVVSDRLVVTIGVDDLVIVDTPDAILVCHRDRAQDVKAVVEALRKQGRDDLT
jgi:mannose-1-phosphate guanylyltransferase